MEPSRHQKLLKNLQVGAKLLVQCKNDWRAGVISRVDDEKIILSICSPSGRTYRKSCAIETAVNFDGEIPFLGDGATWRKDFAKYDSRW
ncbi:MAG: hypothetical protein ACR2GD_10240 [Pyrinomonadaceae bacterium]